MREPWDYLIVTASNDGQAHATQVQLDLRKRLGLLEGFGEVMVIADPEGRRVGSGGSTIHCILQVLSRRLPQDRREVDLIELKALLDDLRILIIHAGGDSRRLPPYGPSGKLLIPLPGESSHPFSLTILDRQLPVYKAMPSPEGTRGQVVIATGDVLLDFDPELVEFSKSGLTGLGCYAFPEHASKHGVYCSTSDGVVDLFLQKPTEEQQEAFGAINRQGRAVLDIGVMSLDADLSVRLLNLCGVRRQSDGGLAWSGPVAEAILNGGLDFYREICCAMGTSADLEHHLSVSSESGSRLPESVLREVFAAVSEVPFSVQLLPRCGFYHFGTLTQLVDSGNELLNRDYGVSHQGKCVSVNNLHSSEAEILGARSWVEGCHINARLTLAGGNVLAGIDIDRDLQLPKMACLDLLEGVNRNGTPVYFVRCCGAEDSTREGTPNELSFCGRPLDEWMSAVGATTAEIWGADLPRGSLWEARMFPAVADSDNFRDWLWMFEPEEAGVAEKQAWLEADRYSHEEILDLADREKFHSRRQRLRIQNIERQPGRPFRPASGFSAQELSYVLEQLSEPRATQWIAEILRRVHSQFGGDVQRGLARLELSRILHTLGSAVARLGVREKWKKLPGRVLKTLGAEEKQWLESLCSGLGSADEDPIWSARAQDGAFEHLSQTIVLGSREASPCPKSVLRSDEIVWGRAPARLDLGGGWTDTPPYSLERGGCVINAAVTLNGQPPIQVYARVISEPVIRITSIDSGSGAVFRELEELLQYREATDRFGLAKAALVLSGFSNETAIWPQGTTTLEQMLGQFGGGIELTTLAAIPSGSGLGTSSIMGAVLTAVINRALGVRLTEPELFNRVLQLEQELTTGGGWQDQIGGAVSGVKMIATEPGLVPDPRIHFVPADLVDPAVNGDCTLLYYTGIRRLAKNILRRVVGRYLNRERAMMSTLNDLRLLPPQLASSMSRKDLQGFGELIDSAWRLNKQVDPDSTTEVIESILERVRPHIFGAKLLGAGGGGFLLMVAKSTEDAESVRKLLTAEPPNRRARFFEYAISQVGLTVTVC